MAKAAEAQQAGEATREKILAAALEIFSERGFDGARTREIAERADANLGLIKYYFDTKEQLWKAAVDRAFEELGREFGPLLADAAANGTGDLDVLEELVRRFVRFGAQNPAFMRLMNDEGKRDSERMHWLADHHVKPMYRTLEGLFERARERGLVPDLPAVHLHYIVVGAAGLIFSQAPECLHVTGIDPTDEASVETHADAVVRLLLGRS